MTVAVFNEYIACTIDRNRRDKTRYTARLDDAGRKSLNMRQRGSAAGITEFAAR